MTGPWRGLILPSLAATLALAILISLGLWQVERLRWKEALIARVSERIDLAPIPAPKPGAWSGLDHTDLEYRPVSVTGRFLHQYEAHVFTTLNAPRGSFGGMGYLVMTPLATDDGWFVYVNRGFVPDDRKDGATRSAGQTAALVTVSGLFRAPRVGSWLSADDSASDNIWFSRDPNLFAKWRGPESEKVAPYIIDAHFDPDLEGGQPQGGETFMAFSNNHLGYAITWFGLAAGLVGVFVVFARGRLRTRQ
jgi:surfeit locus 1 family protein